MFRKAFSLNKLDIVFRLFMHQQSHGQLNVFLSMETLFKKKHNTAWQHFWTYAGRTNCQELRWCSLWVPVTQEYTSFIWSMSVFASVGCYLAASTRQSPLEFYRCCCGNLRLLSTTKKKKKKDSLTPTRSQTFIVVVGPKVIWHITLWRVDREHHHILTRPVCV